MIKKLQITIDLLMGSLFKSNGIDGERLRLHIKMCIIMPLLLSAFSFEAYGRKIMHISFDDVTHVLNNLEQNKDTYESIFENPLLEKLKSYHDEYGAVFSLYCWTEAGTWQIGPLPLAFAEEFRDNADWLKLGYHSKSSSTSTSDYNIIYYNKFLTVIPDEVEGRLDCFDLVPRLHGFAGSLAFCKALRDATPGLKGFLSADDTRNSYYLNTTQSTYINNNDVLYEEVNDLYFFSTEKRLESVGNIDTHLKLYLTSPAFTSKAEYMIIFTHENQVYGHTTGLNTTNGMLGKIETCLKWAKDNDYAFEFPMNILDEVTGIQAPASSPADFITVEGKTIRSEKAGTIKVYDISGTLVLHRKDASIIDTNLCRGLYLIRFEGEEGLKASKKIIIL